MFSRQSLRTKENTFVNNLLIALKTLPNRRTVRYNRFMSRDATLIRVIVFWSTIYNI